MIYFTELKSTSSLLAVNPSPLNRGREQRGLPCGRFPARRSQRRLERRCHSKQKQMFA